MFFKMYEITLLVPACVIIIFSSFFLGIRNTGVLKQTNKKRNIGSFWRRKRAVCQKSLTYFSCNIFPVDKRVTGKIVSLSLSSIDEQRLICEFSLSTVHSVA